MLTFYSHEHLVQFTNKTALVDIKSGLTLSYSDLLEHLQSHKDQLDNTHKKLIFIAASNSILSITWYLSCLQANHVVYLFDPDKKAATQNLVEHYNPHYIIHPDDQDAVIERHSDAMTLHEDLALLLSTSGSTGTPKFVRLSKDNINSNAHAIADYLDIDSSHRALAHLKLHYSYGLSILHSHLAVGGTLCITTLSVVDNDFWTTIKNYEINSFAGVPYTFNAIDKLSVTLNNYPSLRYITQAGGKMQAHDVVRWVNDCESASINFIVMYGQTEASPRISYLPHSLALQYPGSIGMPIPGGTIELCDEQGAPIQQANTPGELVYKGPNVMMGYAENASDFANSKSIFTLKTGDIATFNEDNIFTIVGRLSRFVKPFGVRVNLDDIQSALSISIPSVVCTGNDESIVLVYPENTDQGTSIVERFIASTSKQYGLPSSIFSALALQDIPLLSNGKIDYKTIKALAGLEGIQGTPTSSKSIFHIFSRSFLVDFLKEFLTILGFGKRSRDIVSIFKTVLGIHEVNASDTFTTLGGDSLSYVTMTIEVEKLLGTLPNDWENMTVQQLNALSFKGAI